MTVERIPVCEPLLAGNELAYVKDAVNSNWISSSGKYLEAFEKGFAAYVGVKHGIAVCNGTVALHLALVAAGVGPGDEVIVPDFTMIAPVFAVCYAGAKPVFVDADPDTWTLDARRVEKMITKKTRALLPVHIYGHPADMGPLRALAKKRKLVVIEDAAEAHGALYRGRPCGALSDLAAFSFFANKNITTGEGGMVVTNNDALAEKCRYHKNLCFPLKGPRTYRHDDIGFNYRLGNLQAAVGLAQLEKIDFYVSRRRRNAALYNRHLGGVGALRLPVEKPWARNCYWMYGVVLAEQAPLGREALMEKLKADGIETRTFFLPMHRQPALKKYGADCSGRYPVTEDLAKNGFYLPSGSGLTEKQILRVCDSLKKHLGE